MRMKEMCILTKAVNYDTKSLISHFEIRTGEYKC